MLPPISVSLEVILDEMDFHSSWVQSRLVALVIQVHECGHFGELCKVQIYG